MIEIQKYPRTRHIEGSRLQPGDEDLDQVLLSDLRGKSLIVEEKVDGANVGISFTPEGEMLLQSRGHYLVGGSAFEGQYGPFKAWATTYRDVLWEILGTRYILYGEWIWKKHTVWYDLLPHFFLEFDVWDLEKKVHLSTELRHIMFSGSPVRSVPVIYQGTIESLPQITSLIQPSLYKSPEWRTNFEDTVRREGLDVQRAWKLVDPSDYAEGLYIKWEEDGQVVRWPIEITPTAEQIATAARKGEAPETVRFEEGRYKFVRADFHQRILEANKLPRGHVAQQPIIPNRLAPGVDLYAY